ncbi:MAG: metallophosphoesterase [Clostridia bacterium]|nr:metallophosphoesterase [Clostridia bacterium]
MTYNTLKNLLSIVMAAVTALFGAALPFGGNGIRVAPAVFEYGEDSYCVMWETEKKGAGCVKYTVDGKEKTVWDEELGVIRTHETVHRVYVPKAELRDNDYRVSSQYVFFKYAYAALKGKTVESDVYHFRGEEKQDGIRILCASDIHEHNAEALKAAKNSGTEPDLVVILGDVASNMEVKERFTNALLGNAAALSGGTVPVVYVRGNHEPRGEFAAQLPGYLPTAGKEMYFTFDFGGLSAVVLDSGEDKEDSHEDYSGLVNFSGYLNEEYEWVRSLSADQFDGKYKLVFSHIPGIQNMWGVNWAACFGDMGFDMIVGGHLHTCKSWNRNNIPIVSEGGIQDDDYWICSIILEGGAVDLRVTDTAGETVYSFGLADGVCTEEKNF